MDPAVGIRIEFVVPAVEWASSALALVLILVISVLVGLPEEPVHLLIVSDHSETRLARQISA